MSQNRIELVITANSTGLQQGMQQATQEVEKLGRTADNTAQGMDRGFGTITAAAQRLLPLLGAAGLAGTLMGVARSGDAMTASLGRLQVATGSVQAAAQTYNDLYRISLQTGVAVSEAAGSFTRFSIAAREIGATRDQVVDLVRTVQMAGAVAGASTAETASATMQLGQALASGRLQGDELRSILEGMPNLAEALARELGVNIGQLRRMGEEGKLTADVVFPALLRAGQNIRQQFDQMPVTMARGFEQLRVATQGFLAQLDEGLRLSQGIAAAAQAAANALDRGRQAITPATPTQLAANDEAAANSRRTELQRELERLTSGAAPQARRGTTARAMQEAAAQGTPTDQRVAALREQIAEQERLAREAGERLNSIAREADDRGQAEAATAAARANAAARQRDTERFTEVRDGLDRERRIREQHRERVEAIERGVLSGATTREDGTRLTRLAEQDRDKQLRELAGAEDRRPERLRDQLALLDANIEAERRSIAAIEQGGVAMRNAEADQRAMQEAMRLFPQRGAEYERALVDLTDKHRRLAEVQAEGRLAQINFTDAMQRDQLALQGQLIGASAVERARRTAEMQRSQELRRQGIDPDSEAGRGSIAMSADLAEQRLELERNQAAFGEFGRIGTQAVDRIGQAITQGTLSLRDMGRIGQSVISELAQAFARLAVINPIRNMMGENLPTASNVFGRLFGSVFGGGSGGSIVPSLDAMSKPGFFSTFHTGGVAGIENPASRLASIDLFRDAPRFHDGGFIGADEVPAILRRGEGVFTPEQMARLGPAGGVNAPVTIHFSGNAGDPRDREALAEMVGMEIERRIAMRTPGIVGEAYGLVMNDMKNNGPLAGMRRR